MGGAPLRGAGEAVESIPERVCPSCGESVLEGSEFCPSCFASMVAPSPSEPGPEAATPESEPAPIPREPPPELAPSPDAPRCPEHPERPVATTCLRCGRFLCIDCEPDLLRKDQLTCEGCLATERLLGAPARIRRLVWEVAAGLFLCGFGIFFLTAVLPFLIAPEFTEASSREEARVITLSLLIAGGVLSLPFVGTALLLVFSRWGVVAWVGFALELLLAAASFLLLAFGSTTTAYFTGGVGSTVVGVLAAHAFLRCLELGNLKTLVAGQTRR